MKAIFAILVIATGLVFGEAARADFQDGMDAADNGEYAIALREWRPLAKRGHARAQFALGAMYAFGNGVEQDYKAAAKWYLKAAEQGLATAQNSLGRMYENGEGVMQDYREAAKWYRKSAEQGFASAATNLGSMHFKGLGVLKNNMRAHMWSDIGGANGDERGAKNRETFASKMSPHEIGMSQLMAELCMTSDYKECY